MEMIDNFTLLRNHLTWCGPGKLKERVVLIFMYTFLPTNQILPGNFISIGKWNGEGECL